VSFHGGGVDQNLRGRAVGSGERLEQIDPYALCRPSHVAIVKCLLRPIIGRRIDPATARFQDMHNAADDPPVVDTFLAPRIRRKVWRNLRKLLVRQPELVPIHPRFLSEAVNHKPLLMPTILCPDPRAYNLGL
jgi:hypothetical protein